MFIKKFRILLTALLIALGVEIGNEAVAAPATGVITKAASRDLMNPTLAYAGVSGNKAVSDAVGSFIRACGWFDVRNAGAGEPDYVLSGTAQGGSFTLLVQLGGAPLFKGAFPIVAGQERETAKKAVDAVLAAVFKQFKVKGICNSKIVFCLESSPGVRNLFMCDIDGKGVKQLTKFNSLCVEPGWFPNGESVAYTKYNRSSTDILETRIDSGQTRRLASYPGLNVGAAIHPKGQYLALILSLDNQVELYVKPLNSANKRRMTSSRAVEAAPCWSPDGNNICYVTDEGSRVPRLASVNVATKQSQRIPTFSQDASTPDWSDDNKIVYSCKQGAYYALAVVDLNDVKGKMSGIVVGSAGDWESPSWAPDNRHVVCIRTLGRKSSLYIVDTFSKNERLLFTTDKNLYMPAWSPLMKK